jgi:hypothetical protein
MRWVIQAVSAFDIAPKSMEFMPNITGGCADFAAYVPQRAT